MWKEQSDSFGSKLNCCHHFIPLCSSLQTFSPLNTHNANCFLWSLNTTLTTLILAQAQLFLCLSFFFHICSFIHNLKSLYVKEGDWLLMKVCDPHSKHKTFWSCDSWTDLIEQTTLKKQQRGLWVKIDVKKRSTASKMLDCSSDWGVFRFYLSYSGVDCTRRANGIECKTDMLTEVCMDSFQWTFCV